MTSIWEIDGVTHRDVLSNVAFIRELRNELRRLFEGAKASDKSSRPPVLDGDCYWNYREAKCEFPQFCEYRYVFGDLTLDQSCRIRARTNVLAPINASKQDVLAQSVSEDQLYSFVQNNACPVPCSYCLPRFAGMLPSSVVSKSQP